VIENPFAVFFIGLIFLFIFSIYKYLKTKEKSYLLLIVGFFMAIVGYLISYKNAGYIIMSIGYVITMIGLFILLTSRMEWSERKLKRKGLLYNPHFQRVGVIAAGVLLIAFGIYTIISDFGISEFGSFKYIKGAVAILWGVGFIIYAILRKRKKKVNG
jgi:hypothetical protein